MYVNLLSKIKILSMKPCDEIGSQHFSVSNLFDVNSHSSQSKSGDFSKNFLYFLFFIYIIKVIFL